MGKEKYKVLIMKCDDYDPEKIAEIVDYGMKELGVTPSGNILLKPNTVIAQREFFPNAFTRKEFIDGVISAVKQNSVDAKKIVLGERSGITIPTRYTFRNAGYHKVIKKHRIKAAYFDEEKQVPIKIDARERLRDQMFFPESIASCDFLINLPKFKAHPWCRLTLSLKNFIGIQDDRHRLVDHNSFLEHKIADLQEVIQPQFIAIDAISAGQKMMLTPEPFPMGAIVMGTNSCAVDTVGCHMVNVDPKDLIHLKFASERGYGPMNLKEIDLGGDFPLKEVQKKTAGFQFCLEHVDKYFKNTKLNCTVGTFPEKHSPDYCWGGCPGALQEAIHMTRAIVPDVENNMKKIRYVVGRVEGPLDLDEDENVIFAGDCTSWQGTIDGKEVHIESRYRSAGEVDETKTRSNDMLYKLIGALSNIARNSGKRYIRAGGCPVSVGDHIHYLSFKGGFKNINFFPKLVFPYVIQYIIMWIFRIKNRVF
jgi:uncharacterized protein (DUF362 family)